MNHPWEQPIRPLEVLASTSETQNWNLVLFIRPRTSDRGWEVISWNGVHWTDAEAILREVTK